MLDVRQPSLVVRQKSPLNVEFQFASLSDWLTPCDQFYVRSHFSAPELNEAEWRLRVDGAVQTPLQLNLDELKAMPPATLAAVMECAGNGRVFYEPVKEGLQWQSGAVGNASWTGVRLRDVLAKAGVKGDAVEVVLIGADRGIVDAGKKTASPGPVAFARSLPLIKALSDGVLLAYAMNDEPLAVHHGFPLRAVVGGWYGMAWIKWIKEVRVVERPFLGYRQAATTSDGSEALASPRWFLFLKWRSRRRSPVPCTGPPFRQAGPTGSSAPPGAGRRRSRRSNSTRRMARTGRWRPCLARRRRSAGASGNTERTPPQPGRYSLRCRAIDTSGNVQPDMQQPDRESYLANWTIPTEVRAITAADHEPEFVI